MAKRSRVQCALWIIAALVCVIAVCHKLPAQSFYGSVVGTVLDKSGAVIPGTNITLTNLGTNNHQTAQSDGNGNYRFLNLVPGHYQLIFEKDGFQRLTRNNFEIDVQAAVRIDAAMQVGQVTQSVEVSTATPLLDTENATVSQVIESQTVQDTPLNGRNVSNLIQMAPGVVPQAAAVGPMQSNSNSGTQTLTQAWSNYQIGGGMSNQNSIVIDGVPVNRPDGYSAAISPTQDSVQQFRIESNNIGADSGRTAGGVINMTTKSGTNRFHGALYDYIENTLFNANAFFNNRLGVVRPQFVQNQYGANFSGAIKKDKLFAFASFENTVYRLGGPTLFTVPTPAELAGDFSDPALPAIYDPLTVCSAPGHPNYGNPACALDSKGNPVYVRKQFPGNKIPASRIDPAALVLRTYWAPPTGPGYTNNYAVNQHIEGGEPQENGRLDWTISQKQRAFAHYTNSHGSTSAGDPFFKGLVGNTLVWNNQLAVLGDTYIFSPNTVGQIRIGYVRFHQPSVGIGVGQPLAQFGPEWAKLASQVTFQGWPQTSQTAGIFGFFLPSITYNDADSYSINADVTKNFGRHSVKLGGESRRMEWYSHPYGAGEGTFGFNANFTAQNAQSAGSTGHTIASFLLGFPNTGSANWNINSSMYQYYNALFAEDSYKATRKLQIVYGVRWDVSPGQWAEKHGNAGILDPNATDPLGATVGLPLKGQIKFVDSQSVGTSSIHPSKRNLFAPRLGITYLLTPNTVVRTGYGILYVPTMASTIDTPVASSVATGLTNMVTTLDSGITPAATYQYAGGAITPTNGYTGGQSAGTLSHPFPTGLVHASGRDQAALTKAIEGGSITAPIYDVQFPNMQQWNLSLENQSVKGILVGVAYAGAKGTHLAINGNPQMNQLADQFDICGTDKTQPQCSYRGVQHLLTDQVANPFYGFLPTSAGAFATSPTLQVGQLLRPYPQFQNVINPATYLGGSTYHALQVRAERRFGSAGVLGGNFTWAKLLSNTDSLAAGGGGTGTVQNWNNLSAEKTLVAYDIPVRVVIRYVYPLPFGKGARFLNGLSNWQDRFVSGWGLDGVSTFQGGKPLLFTATPTSLSNNFGAGTPRPNFVQGCNLKVPGSPYERLNQWFNTSCFTAPSTFGFGNMARAIGTVRAQGLDNFDMALSKKTSITESLNLELRVEAFNLFNHPVFNPPGTQFGAGGGAFGATQAAVASQVNQPRQLQVAGKLTF